MAKLQFMSRKTAFGPDDLRCMEDAYDRIVRVFPKLPREEIATYVIDLARTGISNASTLASQVEFLFADSKNQFLKGSSPFG